MSKSMKDYQRNVTEGAGFLQDSLQQAVAVMGREATLDCLLTLTFALAIAGRTDIKERLAAVAEDAVKIAPLLEDVWVDNNCPAEYAEWFGLDVVPPAGSKK